MWHELLSHITDVKKMVNCLDICRFCILYTIFITDRLRFTSNDNVSYKIVDAIMLHHSITTFGVCIVLWNISANCIGLPVLWYQEYPPTKRKSRIWETLLFSLKLHTWTDNINWAFVIIYWMDYCSIKLMR